MPPWAMLHFVQAAVTKRLAGWPAQQTFPPVLQSDQARGAGSWEVSREPASRFLDRRCLALPSRGSGESSLFSSPEKGASPITGPLPSESNPLPTPPPNTITLGIRFQHRGLGDKDIHPRGTSLPTFPPGLHSPVPVTLRINLGYLESSQVPVSQVSVPYKCSPSSPPPPRSHPSEVLSGPSPPRKPGERAG